MYMHEKRMDYYSIVYGNTQINKPDIFKILKTNYVRCITGDCLNVYGIKINKSIFLEFLEKTNDFKSIRIKSNLS